MSDAGSEAMNRSLARVRSGIDAMVHEFYDSEPVVWLEVGIPGDEYGKAVGYRHQGESGWYIWPFCAPGCCDPEGPFAQESEARGRARAIAAEYLLKGQEPG